MTVAEYFSSCSFWQKISTNSTRFSDFAVLHCILKSLNNSTCLLPCYLDEFLWASSKRCSAHNAVHSLKNSWQTVMQQTPNQFETEGLGHYNTITIYNPYHYTVFIVFSFCRQVHGNRMSCVFYDLLHSLLKAHGHCLCNVLSCLVPWPHPLVS